MSNSVEVAITSEKSGQLWNACMWDPHAGTSLMTYRGGGVGPPRSLCLLGMDYLLMSDQSKPVLHAWQLNSQQPVKAQGVRLVCPGLVNSLAVSPDGNFCVTAVAEKIHVWQLSSGCHLAVAVRHFQRVSCVAFTDDGSHFVSAGEDGLVLVWSLAYLISANNGDSVAGQTEPRHIFSDHSLPVRDIYLGPGGIRARLITVSSDRTSKFYDLASGTLLLSVTFDCALNAVTMDPSEFEVFVGGVDGVIYQFSLRTPPRMREYYLTGDQKAKTFSGHTRAITCLSASKDGVTLLSGSLDSCVMLWHIPSRQCIRVLQHKGPVTNAFFVIAPTSVFLEEMKTNTVLQSFQRNSDTNENNLTLTIRTQPNDWQDEDGDRHIYDHPIQVPVITSNQDEDVELKKQIALLKKVNADLFSFAKDRILLPLSNKKQSEMNESEPKSLNSISLPLSNKKQSEINESELMSLDNDTDMQMKKKQDYHSDKLPLDNGTEAPRKAKAKKKMKKNKNEQKQTSSDWDREITAMKKKKRKRRKLSV